MHMVVNYCGEAFAMEKCYQYYYLRQVFALFGILETIILDNETHLVSVEFCLLNQPRTIHHLIDWPNVLLKL